MDLVLQMVIVCSVIGIVYAIKKRKEHLEMLKPKVSSEMEAASRYVKAVLDNDDSLKQEKLDDLIQTIRTAIIMHDSAKGRVSAEHTLLLLKRALLKIDGKSLTITTEDQARAELVIRQYVELCNANGFKTH